MEDLQIIRLFHKQNLESLSILKQATRILYDNPKFIFFNLLTSLPFFYMMFIYEIFFQTTLFYALNVPNQTDHSSSIPYALPIPTSLVDTLTEKYYRPWVDMASFYFTALFFSELYAIFVTVVLASKIYRRQRERCLTIKEMILVAFTAAKWDSACATAFYIHVISTFILLGSSVLLAATHYFITRYSSYSGYFFSFLSASGILILLKKYLELSAKWHIGIVVSILESENGAEARRKSAYYGKGSECRGFMLMLVFFVWGLGLRCLSMFDGWDGERGIAVQVGLFCIGNLMKWVVCTVYFFDCKARVLEKKSDDDEGRGVFEMLMLEVKSRKESINEQLQF